MNENYIELRTRNSFGDIINTYFLFLKYNFKSYINLYLRYNAISIILTLFASYFLVTGFMGLASSDFRFGMDSNVDTEIYFVISMIILLIIVLATSLINYSFSSAYVADYVENGGSITSKNIWQKIKNNIGTIIIFIIIGAVMYVIYWVIVVIISFIPVIGMLAQYGLNFTMTAVFGLTFMSIFSTKKGIMECLSEGFDFTFFQFWRIILFGLVIGFLNFCIFWLLFQIPSLLMGTYAYFAIESGVELQTSVVAKLLFSLWFTIILLALIFTQALAQVSYGILYYNIFETRYNVFLKEKINKIGVKD